MIYSNDETDRSYRKKKYLISVYLIPVLFVLLIFALLYFGFLKDYVLKKEEFMGYFLATNGGVLIYFYNKTKWLKMPDGTFLSIKANESFNLTSKNEPIDYEHVYFNGIKEKLSSLFLGISLLGIGSYFVYKGVKSFLMPILVFGMGIFFIYIGVKQLLDKSALLKLAKKGLWTKRLGFVDWNNVLRTTIIEERKGSKTQIILEIYLKGTVFAEAKVPDERISLAEVEDNQFVELIINDLRSKRNE